MREKGLAVLTPYPTNEDFCVSYIEYFDTPKRLQQIKQNKKIYDDLWNDLGK